MSEINEEKKNSRFKARSLLNKTPTDWFTDSRFLVVENLKKLLLTFNQKDRIAILSWIPHFRGEVDLSFLTDLGLDINFSLFCPRCSEQGEFTFYLMPSELSPGMFGIPEPVKDESRQIRYSDYDLVVCLIPGLAFDRHGLRLGRGKGLYDRFLINTGANLAMLKVGVCWSFQLFESIPYEEHDQRVNFILTEKELLTVGS